MKKLPLTFVIPIKIDTDDRRRNFDVVMNYLLHHFDCPIIVKEAGGILESIEASHNPLETGNIICSNNQEEVFRKFSEIIRSSTY